MIPLGDLIRAIPEAWSDETRGNEHREGRHPAAGQCTVSSLLIRRHHGGRIIGCVVGATRHYFNDLEGIWLDVTRAQFGARMWPYKKITPDPSPTSFIFNDTWDRVDILENRVMRVLS